MQSRVCGATAKHTIFLRFRKWSVALRLYLMQPLVTRFRIPEGLEKGSGTNSQMARRVLRTIGF